MSLQPTLHNSYCLQVLLFEGFAASFCILRTLAHSMLTAKPEPSSLMIRSSVSHLSELNNTTAVYNNLRVLHPTLQRHPTYPLPIPSQPPEGVNERHIIKTLSHPPRYVTSPSYSSTSASPPTQSIQMLFPMTQLHARSVTASKTHVSAIPIPNTSA